MPRARPRMDPTLKKLEAIEELLQDILILQGAGAAMTRDQVREMLGVSPARISAIWKHLKVKQKE